MNATVWKFHIPKMDRSVIELPQFRSLHVGVQGGEVYLWAMVDPSKSTSIRVFRLVSTGHPVNPEWQHLGTCFDGPYVWHLFQDNTPRGQS